MTSARSGPEPDATPTVSVVGHAALRAEPDEALVIVSVRALEPTPGAALQDIANRGQALVALLDGLAIAPSDRSTTATSVREEFDHTQDGRRSLGHLAASAVAVRLTSAELIGRLVTRATTELDAHVDGPSWQIAASNPIRLDAARAAASDGRRKAQAYAEGVGARLGALVSLAEPTAGAGMRRTGGLRAVAASGGDMPIEAGEQEITATIEVTFALIV